MSDVIFCFMGPTASGKTAIACEWVQQLPCEIISVDSALIYQGMDIGTAKPDGATLKAAPHHLIDICSPLDRYSAAKFCEDAGVICEQVRARGNIPLLVGGTMMYFHALQQGLSVLPDADEAIRTELVVQQHAHGLDYMHDWLKRVDPVSAQRLHPHDTQRIHRALEVFLLTKTPLSDYFAQRREVPGARFINIALFPTRRAWLHERINDRFNQMLAAGFVEEVKGLVDALHLTNAHPSMRAVGYRQALDYVAGVTDYKTFCAQGMAATRQLAKRQLTWLRSWPDVTLYDAENANCMPQILAHANKIMDNA